MSYQTFDYRITKGSTPSYKTLFKATVIGPFVDYIGHNAIGLTPKEATDKLSEWLSESTGHKAVLNLISD